MRNTLTAWAALAAFLCGGLVVWAEDAKPATPADQKQVDVKKEMVEHAKLRVKLHRTLADLIEARIADQPDQAKIDQLAKEVAELRAQIGPPRGDWRGPGPGMGYGRGPGFGRGPGYGRGMGPGPGRGMGGGPGYIDRDNNGVCDHAEAPPAK